MGWSPVIPPGGGGGGGYAKKFGGGGLSSTPLSTNVAPNPFIFHFWQKKEPFSYAFYLQMVPLPHTLV